MDLARNSLRFSLEGLIIHAHPGFWLARNCLPCTSERPPDTHHHKMHNFPFVRVLCGVLDAVSELHNFGYVHRDIKPDNILVDEHGDGKLTDFGMSIKVSDASRRENIGDGTPAYCAPETSTLRGATLASEIYAVAVVFVEGVINNCPFGSEVGYGGRSIFAVVPRCRAIAKSG